MALKVIAVVKMNSFKFWSSTYARNKGYYAQHQNQCTYFWSFFFYVVAFRIYDMDNDGFISNGELFQVLKMMVGNNLKETQLQQIVDKTVINADKDGDGKISFSEFCAVSLVN